MPVVTRPFDPVQIAHLGSALIALEGGVATAAGGVLLWGWSYDPDGEVRALHAELDGRSHEVELLDRAPRPDVVEMFGADWPAPAPNAGWLGFVQLEPEAAASLGGEVRLRVQSDEGSAVTANRLRYQPGVGPERTLLPHLPLRELSPQGLRRVGEALWRPEAERAGRAAQGRAAVRVFGPDRRGDLSLVIPWRAGWNALRDTLAYLDIDPQSRRLEVVLVLAGGQDAQDAARAIETAATELAVLVVHGAGQLSVGAAARLGAEAATSPVIALMADDVVPPSAGWVDAAIEAASAGAWLTPARMARFDGAFTRVSPWPGGERGTAWSHADAFAALRSTPLADWSPGLVIVARELFLKGEFAPAAMATAHGFWTALLVHALDQGARPFGPGDAFTLAPAGRSGPGEVGDLALLDLYALAEAIGRLNPAGESTAP